MSLLDDEPYIVGDRDPVVEHIQAGEDSRTEFKELHFGSRGVSSPNSDDLAAAMVAFANSDGGTLYLGIADDGRVRGIPREKLDLVGQWVMHIAADLCNPPIRPKVERVLVDVGDRKATLVLAHFGRGLYVHQTPRGRFLVRVGTTTRDLTPTELARLFHERGGEYVFDEGLVPSATANDLSRTRLEAHFGVSPSIPWADLLRNTRVTATDEGGFDRPSVAGLLTFALEPTNHLSSAYVEAACYRETRLSSNDLIRAERLAGPVGEQINATIAFVMHFMGTGRAPDTPVKYDIGVIDEAIVNAIAHRDYSISGSKIRCFLFADRLELYIPGKLPNGIMIDEMPYRTFTRNQLLVSFLSKMRSARTGRLFLESRGEGVRKILENGEEHSGRRPEYELFGNELRLTIWARK